MKTINLYIHMQFTSLSPDAQIISLGIVSDEVVDIENNLNDLERIIILMSDPESEESEISKHASNVIKSKTFYAEFTDFDINRCDDWVKENVIKKLQFNNETHDGCNEWDMDAWDMCLKTDLIKNRLSKWLSQFSDYQIQFVVDCGTFDWYHFLQLVAEWDEIPCRPLSINIDSIPKDINIEEFIKEWNRTPVLFVPIDKTEIISSVRTGLPKLPSNISPIPFDLNDLISIKEGITPKEAFDEDRELLAFTEDGAGIAKNSETWLSNTVPQYEFPSGKKLKDGIEMKHSAIWDAQVIKTIYNKLK
jgi:hypothetical protein